MPNFASVFKALRTERELSQQELSNQIGLSKSAINMYERGERQPNFETLELIADFFNVDIDYLLGRTSKTTKIIKTDASKSSLSTKDTKDIEKILEQTREQLTNQEGLMFNGDPVSPEAIESILAAMQIGMEIAKKKNKEKYTPKKYKKD